MKLSIVIPIYYCDPALFLPIEMCLSTLRACYPWVDPILIDDASPLPLPSHWEIAETNPINLGYTATVNKGLAMADGDILVVCNDDLQFYPHCLDRYLDLEDMVIASPADTASGDMEGFGAIFGMTRTTYELLGPLDERMKHFYSDTEYIERAKRKGVENVKWKDIVLEHPESSTFKLLGNKEELLAEDRETWETA